MKKNLKDLVGMALASAALVASVGLVGCGGNNASASSTEASASTAEASASESSSEASAAPAAAAPDEAAGFTEIPIFEDEEAGFMNVSAVYFQAVPMAPGQENYEDYDCHLEADISALENDLGYEVGSWVPYLTIDYKVTKSDGSVEAEGTFMHMTASDGPHYGANIAMPDGAGTYTVEFTIHSPAEENYLIHLGETGPGGTLEDAFKDGNIVISQPWDYVPVES
ncbi:MAG: iron transporter [Atopobiaceae bacterium]|nr:iron transporter [Atopobiaceae bacterium]